MVLTKKSKEKNTSDMPKSAKTSHKKPVRELQSSVEIQRGAFKVQKRSHMKPKIRDLLVLACKREMPRIGVTEQDVANGQLLQAQFWESEIRVVNLTHRTMMALGKSEILNTLAFLKSNASFYDVELMLTDPPRFSARLTSWMTELRQSKNKSNVNIGQTLMLDNIYTRTVTNESNMYKGRNTTADVSFLDEKVQEIPTPVSNEPVARELHNKGDKVVYKTPSTVCWVTILAIHLDDAPNIYYTVQFPDGNERQTTSDRLYPNQIDAYISHK